MAGESWINNGTALLFSGVAGADVAFSMEGVATGAGRISAQHDAGAVPRPFLYTFSCELQLQATPTQYNTVDFFLAEAPDSDNTQVAGDSGTTDAALGDVDAVRNMRFIGSVVSENAAASEVLVKHGEFITYARYFSIVGLNNTGASINATDSNFRFDVTPRYLQAQ